MTAPKPKSPGGQRVPLNRRFDQLSTVSRIRKERKEARLRSSGLPENLPLAGAEPSPAAMAAHRISGGKKISSKPKKSGGQKKAQGTHWAKPPKPRREPAAVAAMVAVVPMARLACGNGCGKTFSYPGSLRNHEKICAERAAQSGRGDGAAGFSSSPARCAGCGGRYVYLAIHEKHCHGLLSGLRIAMKEDRNDRGRDRDVDRDKLCRKGCGRRYVYSKSLKTHEMTCRGLPDAKPSASCSSARNAPRAFLSEEQKAEDDPRGLDATANHAARAAANDAFTRAVFARLAGAGETERRFKRLDATGELASLAAGESSGTAEGRRTSSAAAEEAGRRAEEEAEEARKDAEVDRALRERFPYTSP